eukprot:1007259-Pyramimonas_sp.AAC.1
MCRTGARGASPTFTAARSNGSFICDSFNGHRSCPCRRMARAIRQVPIQRREIVTASSISPVFEALGA